MKKYILLITMVVINIVILAGVLLVTINRPKIEQYYEQDGLSTLINGMEETGFYLTPKWGEFESSFIATPEFTLPKGIYRISGEYETNGGGRIYAAYTDNYYKENINGIINLSEMANEFSFDLNIDESGKPFRLYFRLSYDGVEGDYLLVRNIGLKDSTRTVWYYGFLCIVTLLLLDALLWGMIARKRLLEWFHGLSGEQRLVGTGLFFTIILISLPVMTGYLIASDDLAFHLTRIEGIKDGLLNGQFPIRISPGWMNNHGYANSIMYGELFLYLPALLRLVGLPLRTVFSIYVIGVNAATVLVAWHCFRKISGRSYIGFMAAVFYSANTYRLVNLYVRTAVGEYTAMLFFPLIAYGLWKLFTEEPDREGYQGIWKVLAVGYSGVILSHTISTMLAAVYTLIICLVMCRKVFRKQTFLVLAKALLMVILINAWFLVPFLDYMGYEWLGNAYDPLEAPYRITRRAERIPQFFATDYETSGIAPQYGSGIAANMPLTLGIASAIILAVGIMIKGKRERRYGKQEVFLYLLTIFTMVATSSLFPWLFLCRIIPPMNMIARLIQYPWRLNAVVVILLALLACLIAEKLKANRMLYSGFIMAVLTFSILQGLDFESRVLNEQEPVYVDELGSGRFDQSNGEYLPVGANPKDYVNSITALGEAVEIIDWSSQENSVRVSVKNHGALSGFEVPLLNYKGYQAKDVDNNQLLPITSGTSGRIQVEIPEGYGGTVLVKFVSPWYWRVAELITLLAVIALIGWGIMRWKKPHLVSLPTK